METSALLVFSLFILAEGYVLKDDNKPFEGQQPTFYHTQQWSGMSRGVDGQPEVFSGAAAAAKSGQVNGGAYSVAAAVGKDCSEENEDTANENKNTGFQRHEQYPQTNQLRNDDEQKPVGFDQAFQNSNSHGNDKFGVQNFQSNHQNRQQRNYDLGSNSNKDGHSNDEDQKVRNNESNDYQQKPIGYQSYANSHTSDDFKYQANSKQDFENKRQQGEFNSGFKTDDKHSTNNQKGDSDHQNNGYQGNGYTQSSSYSNQPENLQSESQISQIKGYKDPNQQFNNGNGKLPQKYQNLQFQGQNQNDQANQENGNSAQSYKRGDLGYNLQRHQYRRFPSQNKQQEGSQNNYKENNNGQWQQTSNNNSQLAPKDDESDSREDKSTVGDALKLASEGLQTSQKAACSTCDKGSFAFSNAKSHSGSAVAISIGG